MQNNRFEVGNVGIGMKVQNFTFEPVSDVDEHIFALYQLLIAREEKISHSDNPKYSDHTNFVKNHPYRKWYLVKSSDGYIGSFYISLQNTIGINVTEGNLRTIASCILRFVCNRYEPLPAIPSVRGAQFAINVSPQNTILIEELEKVGSQVLQVTYTVPEKIKK